MALTVVTMMMDTVCAMMMIMVMLMLKKARAGAARAVLYNPRAWGNTSRRPTSCQAMAHQWPVNGQSVVNQW
eukprot:2313785-Lingulodinium_polyedra.AAC.1